MDSPPPPFDTTSLMLSSEATEVSALMTAAVPPPEHATCLDLFSREVVQSGTHSKLFGNKSTCDYRSTRLQWIIFIQRSPVHHNTARIIPHFNTCNASSIVSWSWTWMPRLRIFEVLCPIPSPPSYETAVITLRPQPAKITSRYVTAFPDHVISTVPSTERAAPSINHLPVSNNHRPIPQSTSGAQPGRINREDTTATQLQMDEPPCDPHGLSFVGYVALCSVIMAFVLYFILFYKRYEGEQPQVAWKITTAEVTITECG